MTDRNIFKTPALIKLNALYEANGFELVFVGGCVRDSLRGIAPADIDMATSATPAQQVAMCEANGLRYIETGLQHGTITIVMDGETYEITTYRIDRETDGRHAVVEFTPNLIEDLARRDLTINAMAMDFDGNIIDPFGGSDDLKNGVVRFVGNASDRVVEDYLRILRYFRFYGRMGAGVVDNSARSSVELYSGGLVHISVERIWSEMAKIVSGPNAEQVLSLMAETNVLSAISIMGYYASVFTDGRAVTRDPAALMAFLLRTNVSDIATAWKWSNEERNKAEFIVKRAFTRYTVDMAKRDIYEKVSRELVNTVLRYQGEDIALVEQWTVPVFPVTGDDMLKSGVPQGPKMGQMLKDMKEMWIRSDYTLDKQALMGSVEA